MPTLLISGLESPATRTSDERTTVFPKARKVGVADAGHWVHHDQLDRFLTEVNDFLNG